jgi:hypothetical protein
MRIGRPGQVREIAGQPKPETRARTLRLTTAIARLLRRPAAGAGTRMAVTRTETARINHRHVRVRRLTRMHRRTTIVEEAVRTKLQLGLTPHRRAVTRRQPALIRRLPIRHLRVLTLLRPTQRLRVATPLPAAVMEAVEAGVAVVEVAAALTAEAVVADRMAVALMEAVRTGTDFRAKSPPQNWSGLFLCSEAL